MGMPLDKKAWQTAHLARYKALENIRAQELAQMTDEEALRIMKLLVSADVPWQPRPDWSGLVEQQDTLHRRGK